MASLHHSRTCHVCLPCTDRGSMPQSMLLCPETTNNLFLRWSWSTQHCKTVSFRELERQLGEGGFIHLPVIETLSGSHLNHIFWTNRFLNFLIVLFLCFQAGGHMRRPNPGLVFLRLFCVVVFLCSRWMLLCCVRFSFFSTSQEIGWEECLRCDQFCVKCDVKP